MSTALDLAANVRKLRRPKEHAVATRRSKKSLSSRPKYKQERSLKNRRTKAKLAGRRKKSVNRIKAARARRGGLKKR
jgi:hypothetical protein